MTKSHMVIVSFWQQVRGTWLWH